MKFVYFLKVFEMFDDNNSAELDFDEFNAVLNCISGSFK
jgi:hypothetical protein